MDTRDIYRKSLIWDDHCGFSLRPGCALDPLLRPWRDAGVDYLSINVYYDPQPWTSAVESIAILRRRLPDEAPFCQVISTVDEVDQVRAQGGMAITFDIEGMNALDGRLELVQLYYDLGVRHMLFAYNRNNPAGSGCHDEDTGLTDFGRQVIDEMNRVGMVVDCSHTGFETTMAAMERSTHPVVFSHSNARALVDHGRNITDEQIMACAQTGGVVGVSGVNLLTATQASIDAIEADTNELQVDNVPGLIATAQADLDILTGTDGVTLATAQGLYAPSKAGDAMTLTAAAVDLIWDELIAGHLTADSAGKHLSDIFADTNELITDDIIGQLELTDAVADSILALLDNARGEPAQGAPPVNPDMATKVDYLYKFLRNKIETTATQISVYDDAGAVVDHKSTISDDATTFTRGEIATGP